MSRLNDLLRRLENNDPALAKDLKREVDALAGRRAFGLNFERHAPEAVELPGRPVRRGDKVRVLPPRGSKVTAGDVTLWRVVTIVKDAGGLRTASLQSINDAEEMWEAPTEDLVVVAEFRDPIYPGLVSTGKVERGGDKPYHAVINAENYHALQTLLFTHRAKIDAIYIDPPYNSGAKDWKYNNDYVEGEDLYRHSKWLAFMERRLKLAKELLNPEDSVLIATIDEKEYLRLGLLLEQTFPGSRIQMVSSVINPKGVSRGAEFRRTDEYLFVVMIGASSPARLLLGPEWSSSANGGEELPSEDSEPFALETPEWTSMMRRGSNAARGDRPSMFYPIYADPSMPRIVEVGDSLPYGQHEAPPREGLVAILPLRRNGSEGRWQISAQELRTRVKQGRVRLGRPTNYGYVVNYLPDGAYTAVLSDQFEISGRAEDGSLIATGIRDQRRIAPTQWKLRSHNASEHGSTLLASFLPGRSFPYPKSLYAVEDALRFFVSSKPSAVVVDFFAGSGTTAHAVMRLNKQDDGNRRSISITNNEVGADEQKKLREQGHRPGDAEWERWGICDYVTKARIAAAITGMTPDGDQVKGEYKFTDEFSMGNGLEENVEFFTLSYEAPLRVSSNREFAKIAPLLWLRAGAEGRRIDDISSGWDLTDNYGVIADLNQAGAFLQAIAKLEGIRIAFIVTDEDRLFESVVRELPDDVEPVRMYEAYLQNFEIETSRSAL